MHAWAQKFTKITRHEVQYDRESLNGGPSFTPDSHGGKYVAPPEIEPDTEVRYDVLVSLPIDEMHRLWHYLNMVAEYATRKDNPYQITSPVADKLVTEFRKAWDLVQAAENPGWKPEPE